MYEKSMCWQICGVLGNSRAVFYKSIGSDSFAFGDKLSGNLLR